MKLLIAIPALNEEASIQSIIERTLAAAPTIIAESPVTAVEITVVSDGSTDRTVELARAFEDRIRLIVFEKNRGYGAAIAEAWRQSDADLLSFLDADGTCDPNFFAALCRALEERSADVVLGCRLNAESQMPLVRRVGNVLFAWMLSVFSMTRVRDVASGMRVVRRTCLPKLMPLPKGLHFTPAMSARAILSRDLKITEIDMPYHEREGESKLNPIRDGLRFLGVILQTAFLYRPSRPLGLLALIPLLPAVLMMIYPTWFYLRHGSLEPWMIYRFLVSEVLATAAVLLWCASYLGRKAADIALSDAPARDKHMGPWGRLFGWRWFWIVPVLCCVAGFAFVAQGFVDFITTGKVYEHWSRFVAMMFFLSIASILVVTRIMDYSLDLLADRLQFLRELSRPEDENGPSWTV